MRILPYFWHTPHLFDFKNLARGDIPVAFFKMCIRLLHYFHEIRLGFMFSRYFGYCFVLYAYIQLVTGNENNTCVVIEIMIKWFWKCVYVLPTKQKRGVIFIWGWALIKSGFMCERQRHFGFILTGSEDKLRNITSCFL